jgi:hypothetical protein
MGHIIRILQDGLSFKNSKIQPALQKTGENAVGSDFIKPANFNRFFQKPRILNGFFHKPRICSDLFFLSRRLFSCCASTPSPISGLRRLPSAPSVRPKLLSAPPSNGAALSTHGSLPQTPIPLRSPISAAACRRPRLHHRRRKRLLLLLKLCLLHQRPCRR